MINHSKNQKGMALVVTLLALVLITAMVVEFSYGVYTGTQNLYNWRFPAPLDNGEIRRKCIAEVIAGPGQRGKFFLSGHGVSG
jgi:hypothetical protein